MGGTRFRCRHIVPSEYTSNTVGIFYRLIFSKWKLISCNVVKFRKWRDSSRLAVGPDVKWRRWCEFISRVESLWSAQVAKWDETAWEVEPSLYVGTICMELWRVFSSMSGTFHCPLYILMEKKIHQLSNSQWNNQVGEIFEFLRSSDLGVSRRDVSWIKCWYSVSMYVLVLLCIIALTVIRLQEVFLDKRFCIDSISEVLKIRIFFSALCRSSIYTFLTCKPKNVRKVPSWLIICMICLGAWREATPGSWLLLKKYPRDKYSSL